MTAWARQTASEAIIVVFSSYSVIHDYDRYDKYLKLEQIKIYDFWYLITLNYRYIPIYCNLNIESILVIAITILYFI